jgi:hypothetical protein
MPAPDDDLVVALAEAATYRQMVQVALALAHENQARLRSVTARLRQVLGAPEDETRDKGDNP